MFNAWISNATFAATNDNSALSIADATSAIARCVPCHNYYYTAEIVEHNLIQLRNRSISSSGSITFYRIRIC